MRGLAGRLLAVAAATAALLLTGVSAASAHTELVRSDPPNGGMVAEGRTELRLWFDEAVGGTSTNVEVRTLGGLAVTSSLELAEDGHAMIVRTEPLERGSYVIDWHALSMVDGHASTGQVIFGSGLRPDVVATSGDKPPTELLVARWLDLAALLIALGAVSVGGRVLQAAGPGGSGVRRRVRRYAAYAALVACYSGVLTAFLRTRAAGAPLQTWVEQTWLSLTGSSWGNLWLLREVALVVAAAALWRWHRRGGAGQTRAVAAGALVVAVLLEGFAGHAAGLPEGSTVAALMGAGHVLAAGVWVGGLAVLALTVLRAVRRDPTLASGPVWRAYSPRAAVASGVLLATGLFEAGRHVPTLDSLGTTVYGKAVLVKVLLFGFAIALAGVNTLLVNPQLPQRLAGRLAERLPGAARRLAALADRLPALRSPAPETDVPSRLARTVTIEAVLLVAAVLAAGLLTSVPTSREVAVATRPAIPHAENIDGQFVTVEAVPEGPGQRRIVVRSVPTVLPEVAPVFAVEATVVRPDGTTETVALEANLSGAFDGALPTDLVGRWTAEIRLHRQAAPDTVVSTSWEQSATPDQLPHLLRTLTGLLAFLILAAIAATILLLRRRGAPPDDPFRPHPTLQRSMS